MEALSEQTATDDTITSNMHATLEHWDNLNLTTEEAQGLTEVNSFLNVSLISKLESFIFKQPFLSSSILNLAQKVIKKF